MGGGCFKAASFFVPKIQKNLAGQRKKVKNQLQACYDKDMRKETAKCPMRAVRPSG